MCTRAARCAGSDGTPPRGAGAGAAVHPPPAPAHLLCAVGGEGEGLGVGDLGYPTTCPLMRRPRLPGHAPVCPLLAELPSADCVLAAANLPNSCGFGRMNSGQACSPRLMWRHRRAAS